MRFLFSTFYTYCSDSLYAASVSDVVTTVVALLFGTQELHHHGSASAVYGDNGGHAGGDH